MNTIPVGVTLVLSWSISAVYLQLGLDRIVAGWIVSEKNSAEFLPIMVLLSSFCLSLVLGSAWQTISILIPVATNTIFPMVGYDDKVLSLITSCILSGATAGDHIGPFGETTLLSGFISGCGVRRHCITQAPYALFVLVLSLMVGTVPVSFDAYDQFVAYILGFVVLVIFVIVACRRMESPIFIPVEAITKDFHHLATRDEAPTNFHSKSDLISIHTNDLVDCDENQTVGNNQESSPSYENHTEVAVDGETLLVPTHTLSSFRSKLQELNSGSSDPILGLVEDGWITGDVKSDMRSPQKRGGGGMIVNREPSETSKTTTFQNKKRLIEATIKGSEKEGNIFSESLRMFLRTAETKFDDAAAGLDLNDDSESADSGDDSLDNLMLGIAQNGWRSTIRELEGDEDDAGTETTGPGEGYTTTGGYTTAGGYTTDGVGSVMEETDDDDEMMVLNLEQIMDNQQRFIPPIMMVHSQINLPRTRMGQLRQQRPTDLHPKVQWRFLRIDPSALINPLTFNQTRNVFAKWMGQVDDAESTNGGGFSKASF